VLLLAPAKSGSLYFHFLNPMLEFTFAMDNLLKEYLFLHLVQSVNLVRFTLLHCYNSSRDITMLRKFLL